jgi:hypothetical protein
MQGDVIATPNTNEISSENTDSSNHNVESVGDTTTLLRKTSLKEQTTSLLPNTISNTVLMFTSVGSSRKYSMNGGLVLLGMITLVLFIIVTIIGINNNSTSHHYQKKPTNTMLQVDDDYSDEQPEQQQRPEQQQQHPSLFNNNNNNNSNKNNPPDISHRPVFDKDSYQIWDCSHRYRKYGSLPHFLIVGVHKGGTTALYSYLARHSQIIPAACKEVKYFTKEENFSKGPGYYRTYFRNLTGTTTITGEGSPNYIRFPLVPGRVHKLIPDVKIIVSLREPIRRFKSHWIGSFQHIHGPMGQMTCIEGWRMSKSDFQNCLVAPQYADGKNPERACATTYFDNAAVRSIYVYQLERWLRKFSPEQILIIEAEKLFADVEVTMQQVVRFLGIRPFTWEELDKFKDVWRGTDHIGGADIEHQCDSLDIEMRTFYEPYNKLLLDLLRQYPKLKVLRNGKDSWMV